MELLLSSDDNYAPLLGITIQSVLENNREFDEIDFYVMDGGISSNNKKKIYEIIENFDLNSNVYFIAYDNVDKLLKIDIKATRALSTYARLLAPSLLPNTIDKIIYMDCDAIVNNSLKEIWETDISDYYFGAVLDVGSKNVNKHLGLDDSVPHFNAGFLLINLKRWRDENLEKKFLDFIIKNNGEVYHNDQGILNYVCRGEILKIHPKYNVLSPFFEKSYEDVLNFFDIDEYYSKQIMDDAIRDAVFIHLTIFVNGQPWYINAQNHPLRDLFEYYANHTPFTEDDIYREDNYDVIWKMFLGLYRFLPFSLVCSIFKIYRKFH